MSIYERAGSPYYWCNLPGRIRLSLKVPVKGATPAQTRENKQLAEAAYNALLGDQARQRFNIPKAGETRTFAKQAAWYEEHHLPEHAESSRDRERRVLARLKRHFGALPLDQIRPARWQEYASARLKVGISLSSIGRELALMKGILSPAVGEYLEHHPLAAVKRKQPRQKAKRTLSSAEDARLLRELGSRASRNSGAPDRAPDAAARERTARRELRDLYVVGVGTLLRQMNLIMLQRRDHRGDRIVVDTKTGPHQVPLRQPTPLQRRAAAALMTRMPKTPDGYFFPEWQARFARDRAGANAKFLQAFRRACARVGVPWGLTAGGVVWHTATRASGATRLLRDYRIDVRTVQFIGGWSSLDQMAQYLGIDRDALFSVSTDCARDTADHSRRMLRRGALGARTGAKTGRKRAK